LEQLHSASKNQAAQVQAQAQHLLLPPLLSKKLQFSCKR
jgi:hypothetical protein